MKRLLDLARALADEPDLDRLLERIVAALAEVSGAESVFLALSDGAELRILAARTAEGGGDARGASRTVLERAIREDRPLICADVREDGELSSARSVQRRGVRSVCAFPLKSRGGPIGAVALDHRSSGAFNREAIESLQAFGAIAGAAVGNARLARRVEELGGRRDDPAGDPSPGGPFSALVGRSAAMARVRRLLERVSPAPWPVTLQGESGTGKELAARAIHENSSRSAGPFVAANCGAVPELLAESEFFGHARGAFTGADRERPGLFELAHGGTLFLDEIEAMAPSLQGMLLRVAQDGVVRRIGGRETRKVDVRLVTASNEDIPALVAAKRFRSDLWHRLNVLRVDLPPLRARVHDIPLLAAHLLARIARETGARARRLSPDALRRLVESPWPGNVRQLENALRQAAALSAAPVLEAGDFDGALRPVPAPAGPPALSVDDYIRGVLDRYEAEMGISWVARQLGMNRKTLWLKKREWKGRK